MIRLMFALPLILLMSCSSPKSLVLPALPDTDESPTPFTGHDLISSDFKNSITFYESVFLWRIQPTGDKRVGLILDSKGEQIGTLLDGQQLSPPAPHSAWLISAELEESTLEERLKEFTAQGGTVRMGPEQSGPRGKVAVVEDPQGGVLMLVEPGEGERPQLKQTPWIWHEMLCSDPEKLAEWYSSSLNSNITELDKTRVLLNVENQDVATFSVNPFEDTPNFWMPVLAVDALEDTLKRLHSAGGKVVVPPSPELADGKLAIVLDPQGAAFALQEQE